ncbi:MAG: Lrp/AsnC family transcriptional regulator [Phycisphaerae bacterium]|nr:Lrp/AsnC family transcriptional regulator [Phycisphaerae bacterium]
MQPDKIDWKIIELLSEQNESNTTIAKELGVSEGMIRQRVKKLQDAGIVKIRALRNPQVLENQQLAMVTANIAESRLLDAKAKEILELENVLSVSILSGQYDLIIEVLVESNKGLIKFLTEQLSKVEGISKTETFLTLKSYNKWV